MTDTASVFAEMDRYLEAAKVARQRPKFFRVADCLLRELSTGTARLASYRGVPIHQADEWAWGWMLRVGRGFEDQWFEPCDRDASLAEDAKRLSGEAVAARAEGIARD